MTNASRLLSTVETYSRITAARMLNDQNATLTRYLTMRGSKYYRKQQGKGDLRLLVVYKGQGGGGHEIRQRSILRHRRQSSITSKFSGLLMCLWPIYFSTANCVYVERQNLAQVKFGG